MARTIRSGGEHELVVKRSRFLCAVQRVADETEAREFIAARRKVHWAATHNCTAYILGPQQEIQRSSDDGEPAGTAGAPMLEVLRGRRLTDTAAVVTRYFGGVKLGAGGLIRAYGNAVSATINQVGVLERRELRVERVTAGHAHSGRLESGLREAGYRVLRADHGAEAAYDVAVSAQDLAGLTTLVAELTSGSARMSERGTTIVEAESDA